MQNKKDKRNIHEFRLYPGVPESISAMSTADPDGKQTREIRRLEKQMQKYLEKLDEMIHKVKFNLGFLVLLLYMYTCMYIYIIICTCNILQHLLNRVKRLYRRKIRD